MVDPFVAEIRIVGFNFPPTGWASCDGQILPISQNTALFSLLGTTYGGNGKSTFGLPNLAGATPMDTGQGPGLSYRDLGESSGSPTVTLIQSEIPAHPHTITGTSEEGDNNQTPNNYVGKVTGAFVYAPPAAGSPVTMLNTALGVVGGDQPHNNRQPYLGLFFVIALQGIFPPRQ